MANTDLAVSVRGLSKAYTIAHNDGERHVTLAEQMLSRFRRPFQRPKTETFWALKDVEFDIKKGEVVGIIGRNGAGKSTLLKILSRITEPTSGEIRLYGRVGSLLEVGTGFHQELTGRENVFLNGAILGMSKAEIGKQFDAIVEFSGVDKFIDTPVKRYSSGMYVRLAFAVAAHLRTEILIVDEVLAVGDVEFQGKCLGKMQDVARSGRTVLFVSHNESAVRRLCTDAIILTRGALSFRGTPLAALAHLRPKRDSTFSSAGRIIGGLKAMLIDARLSVDGISTSTVYGPQNKIRIALVYQIKQPLNVAPEFVIRDANSVQVIFGSPWYSQGRTFKVTEGTWRTHHDILLPTLACGRYSIDVFLVDPCIEFLDVVEEALEFVVDDSTSPATGFQYNQAIGRGCVNVEVC